jgi:hypothetical protein
MLLNRWRLCRLSRLPESRYFPDFLSGELPDFMRPPTRYREAP